MIATMDSKQLDERRRRNTILALVHVAIALGILVAFVIAQSHR